MRSRTIILFLIAVFILVFINACSVSKTSETVTTTVTTTETTSTAEQQYYKEITRISNALTNSTETYYQACDDFLNFDIDLSGHKEATTDFVRSIFVLYNAYEKLEPPDNAKKAHDLFGSSMEHYTNCTEYLLEYVKSGDENGMNLNLEKAVSEAELGAKYLNEANEEIKNVNQY